jgi:hypothetical protein
VTSGSWNGSLSLDESGIHHPPQFKHAADMEWEMGRFGNVTKFLFHPRPERPTEPNAGFLKYAPGASFPLPYRVLLFCNRPTDSDGQMKRVLAQPVSNGTFSNDSDRL